MRIWMVCECLSLIYIKKWKDFNKDYWYLLESLFCKINIIDIFMVWWLVLKIVGLTKGLTTHRIYISCIHLGFIFKQIYVLYKKKRSKIEECARPEIIKLIWKNVILKQIVST